MAPTTVRRAFGDITNTVKADPNTTAKKGAAAAAAPPTTTLADRSAIKAKAAALFPPSADLDVEYMPAPLRTSSWWRARASHGPSIATRPDHRV